MLMMLTPSALRTLQVATLPDTIITRTITERGWLETLVAVEQAIVGLAMLGMLVTMVLVLLAIRKSVQELSRLVQSSVGDISGAAHSVRNVAEDVRGMTKSFRSDLETVGETVRVVNERVRDAVEGAEDRVRRFGELVDTVQEEAEEFVDTASGTLRGVSAGAKAIRHGFSFARWASGKKVSHSRRVAEEEEEDERPVRRRPRFRSRVRPRARDA